MVEPSSWQKFGYYTLGLAPPAVSREWVEKDVGSTGFVVRRALVLVASITIGFTISAALIGGSRWSVLGGFIGALFVAFLQMTVLADSVRRRSLSYYRKKWDRHLGPPSGSTA
jgi:membrane protein YdbS with pleckstrin-like domain